MPNASRLRIQGRRDNAGKVVAIDFNIPVLRDIRSTRRSELMRYLVKTEDNEKKVEIGT